MRNKSFYHVMLVVFMLSTANIFAQESNEFKTFSQAIKQGKANRVKALINIIGGELIVEGSKSDLAHVSFSYFDKYWDPSASYTETSEQRKLIVKSNASFSEHIIKDTNICRVSLNKNLNYSLGIELGAGTADINLQGFSIERALLRFGGGSFNVNLASTSIPVLKIEAGVGEATIDLSGDREIGLNAEITAGIGEMTIIVPENIGVRFKISGFLGEINTPYFKKEGNIYTNKAYEGADIKMEFDVSGAIGSINVRQK